MTNPTIDELRDQLRQIDGLTLSKPNELARAIWIVADTLEAILGHLKLTNEP